MLGKHSKTVNKTLPSVSSAEADEDYLLIVEATGKLQHVLFMYAIQDCIGQ